MLLNAGDREAFTVEMNRPTTLVTLTHNRSVGRFVRQQSRAFGSLAVILRAASDMKAWISPDGTQAIYRFSSPVEGRRTFALVKEGDYWYLW